VKARELLYLLGFRPPPQVYGYELLAFDLATDGRVQYAQWLHPRETRKQIRQEAVDQLRGFLAPGDAAIDIGAHTGDSTLPIALAVGASGTVLALEPNPYVYPVLQKNAELNAIKAHIIPLNFAATTASGEFEFAYSDAGFCNGGLHTTGKWRHGHAFKLKVRGENLQEFLDVHFRDLEPRIRFIKVDAEGYDFEILHSLAGFIRARKPYLMAEVHKSNGRARRELLYDFLVRHGYQISRIYDETYSRSRLDRADLMRWPHYDIFCSP
jgi:FkbM family methyltransferase